MTVHVACITTSRADFGLLRWPMRAIAEASDFRLSIVAGGGHLAPSQGLTAAEILGEGFVIDERVPMYVDAEGGAAAALGAGLSTMGVAQALQRLAPDWVMVLGDRFEVLGATTAAACLRLPICHLCGGDVTAGAYDDAFRHAISKLAHLHFPSTEDSAARLVQMGEEAWRIHVTGSPGLDAIHRITFFEREEVFRRLGLPGKKPLVLATLHPTTLAADLGLAELDALIAVLAARDDVEIVFTGVNADTGTEVFNDRVRAFVGQNPSAVFHQSLGQTLYLNTVAQSAVVVGNSSSGVYEVPSFAVPTVNIGDRQKGRLRAESVIDCGGTGEAIAEALGEALRRGRMAVVNPYGDGRSAERILASLRAVTRERSRQEILVKAFVDKAGDANR